MSMYANILVPKWTTKFMPAKFQKFCQRYIILRILRLEGKYVAHYELPYQDLCCLQI